MPNPISEIVAFRDLVETRDFEQPARRCPIALGKDLEGKPVIADLAKMPHLLIAGATGSGKVGVREHDHHEPGLPAHAADAALPDGRSEDGRAVGLQHLPHLRHKVITDNRDAAAVLKWAVMEMNGPYELLATNGCRNIQDFNVRVAQVERGDGPALKRPSVPTSRSSDRVRGRNRCRTSSSSSTRWPT